METQVIYQESPNFLKHFDGKEAVKSFTAYQVARIKNGEDNPLQFHIHSKALQKALEQIEKEIKPLVMQEAGKYSGEGKTVDVYGAKMEFASLGTKYDYAACNDTQWNTLDAEIKRLGEAKKDRETFLKALKEPMSSLEGEIINPPVKTSSDGIKITI